MLVLVDRRKCGINKFLEPTFLQTNNVGINKVLQRIRNSTSVVMQLCLWCRQGLRLPVIVVVVKKGSREHVMVD